MSTSESQVLFDPLSMPLQHQQEIHPKFPCYALKVRSRSEESVAEALSRKGYNVLFPSYIENRRYSDRIRKVRAALFPGYIFCRFDIVQPLAVLTTSGVSYIVGSGNIFEPLSANEVATVEALSRTIIPSEPCPYLKLGQRVRIESGPLSGVCGILQNIKGTERVVLSIDLLQRSVSVEIGQAFIKSAA